MSLAEFEGLTEPQLEIVDFMRAEAAKLIPGHLGGWLIGAYGNTSTVLSQHAFEMSDAIKDRIDDGMPIQEVELLQHQYKENDAKYGRLRGNPAWEQPALFIVHARLGRKTLQMSLARVNHVREFGTSGKYVTDRPWVY